MVLHCTRSYSINLTFIVGFIEIMPLIIFNELEHMFTTQLIESN